MRVMNYRVVICCVIYASCFLSCGYSFPSSKEIHTSSQTNVIEQKTAMTKRGFAEARQGTLLAAIGTALAPFLIGTLTPLLTQLASMVSTAVLGKLQGEPVANQSPHQYDGYMINMPNQPGPYLFVTTPTRDGASEPKRPASSLVRKTPKISHHLGTVNIRPNVPDQTDNEEHTARDLQLPTPLTDVSD